MNGADTSCRGCTATVRLAPGELQRILTAYLATAPEQTLSSDALYADRLKVCGTCTDLQYGTTCRHCGCLVAVRAKLQDKACPASRW